MHTQLGDPILNQWPMSFADLKDLCKDNSNHQQIKIHKKLSEMALIFQK